MRLAALAIEPRGKDATGFAWTRPNGEAFYWKTPQRAQDAVAQAPLDRDMLNVIAHTRYKTQGDVKDNRNNHPVIDDGIMLVHNGMIDNDYELYRLLGHDFVRKADVDSQVIATMLVNKEAFDAVETTDILEVLEGSAALAWIEYDMPEILHLARVQERPLTIGWTRLGDMVMSSTPGTLANLASWSNTRIRDVWEVPTGTYITVQEGEIVTVEKFTPKESYRTWGYSSGTRFSSHPTTGVKTTTETLISHDKPKLDTGSNVVPFDRAEAERAEAERQADYEAWWAEKEAEEAAELEARIDALLAEDEAAERAGDGRFLDEDGLQWIPIYDSGEITDYVVLDSDGMFIALASADDWFTENHADLSDVIEAEIVETINV